MQYIVINFILLLLPTTTDSELFEGRIEVVQESIYEKSYSTYFVKDENIRIDEFDNDHELIQSLIINIEDERIFILRPHKKLYQEVTLTKANVASKENFTIKKTGNSRAVNGSECYQWRVKNNERNTETTYWVSQNNFYFFNDLIKLLNRTDKTFEFFSKIPETQGFFPMLSVERTLLRKEKLRTSVININKEKLKNSQFDIPKEFYLIRTN